MNPPLHNTPLCWVPDWRVKEEEVEEEEGGATSALDTEIDASMGKETEASGCPAQVPSAERHRQRNHTMRREHTWEN